MKEIDVASRPFRRHCAYCCGCFEQSPMADVEHQAAGAGRDVDPYFAGSTAAGSLGAGGAGVVSDGLSMGGASTGAAPAGGAVGSLVVGLAASVGLGTAAPAGVSVFVPAVLLSVLSFLRLKRALSLSIASSGIPGMWTLRRRTGCGFGEVQV